MTKGTKCHGIEGEREKEIKYDPDEKNTIVGKCNAEQELTN